MFGTNLMARRSRTEQIADQAWEHLQSAFGSAGDTVRHSVRSAGDTVRDATRHTVHSAGDTVRDATRHTVHSARRGTSHLAGEAGDRVGAMRDEAWRRATAASAALAGRRPGLPWLWIIGAAGVGAALGWAAGSAARAMIARQGEDPATAEAVEFVELTPPPNTVRLNN
ncbi:hypothetical protein ACI2K4_15985 [Micromonospora sp. NPDC050397]|uniref:hypothetical protein n=1 Tax=Micromonospora sp. NPDC050397 TaxID=3364279 RepID=UPI003850F417